MRLCEYFDGKGVEPKKDDIADKFRKKPKGTFTPPEGRDACMDLYIELVKNDIISNLKKKATLNLTKPERDAFFELLHNKDIVIRPADKGSGIVVMDTKKYTESLANEIVNNPSYECTVEDTTKESHKQVKSLVNRMHRNGTITTDMKKYLVPTYVEPGKLKGNPKLHKADAPLRTIVSGINTATEKIAELAEYELSDYVLSSESYIRDTTDFIEKLKEVPEPLPQNTILFCFDVVKLYPSVPRKEGLQACREALEQRCNPLVHSVDDMIDIIKTVLDNNNFSLGNNHYKQTEGVAIGSKLGKNFACCYMRKWDIQLLKASKVPVFYKRFIDDGFGVWVGTAQELEDFALYANSIHENIKVELRYDKRSIEFLDTYVRLENGHLYTDLYIKPTDRQLYLRNTSSHPPNSKKALAYGLGLRIRRICEKESDYRKHRADLKLQLRKRGYSGKFIEKQLTKVDELERDTLLKKTDPTKQSSQRVPLVLTYSALLPDVHKIVKKHLHVLYQSKRMDKIFSAPPLVAFRRDTNLCDILVHTKTRRAVECNQRKCSTDCGFCDSISETPVQDSTKTEIFDIATQANCRTRNVVYAISCTRCDVMVYVGETERAVKERMSEHLRDVRLHRDKPIMAHFGIGHTENDLQFSVLEVVRTGGRIERRIRENIWINKLKTLKPQGCNVKDSSVPVELCLL